MAILCEVPLNKDTEREREGEKDRQQQQQNYWYIVHMLLLSSHIVHIRSLYLC